MAYFLIRRENYGWIVVGLLAIPILPMMYLIWYGEPQEIERHALQLYIKFRLAGWLSWPLLADVVVNEIKRYKDNKKEEF